MGMVCCHDQDSSGIRSLGGHLPSIQTLPALQDKVTELYYPTNTKSTYYSEDDYFLSLSKDRKTFKPIRVCEL